MLESLGRVGTLRRGILGLGETFGLSLALLALVMACSLATSSAAGFAGPTVPLVYLTAGFGSLCLASVIIRFTRRMASAGGLYTYSARGLDSNSGFVGGWLYEIGRASCRERVEMWGGAGALKRKIIKEGYLADVER